MKKSFKIGEYVVGGIIQVDIQANKVVVNFLDYNSKKLILTKSFLKRQQSFNEIDMFICENGTSYYADKVCTWIKENIVLPENPYAGW